MRILIVGAGAVGGYFGGRLAAAGVDVTFLVRAHRAAQLAREGLVVRSPHGDLRLPVRTIERAEPGFDLILLACKAYDLAGVITALVPAVTQGTLLLPLLNGLRHLEDLDRAFPTAQVLGGLCHIGVRLTEQGEVEHLNELERLTLGPRTPEQEPGSRAAHATLSRGGFAPVLSAHIMQDLWEKFVFLTAYAGITCLMRAPIGAITAADEGKAIALDLLEECAAVAAASGFAPRPAASVQARAMLTDENSTGTASMLRDMLREGPTEHDHILGDMLARARALGVSAPILRIAYAHLQAYEAVRQARSSQGRRFASS